MCVYVYVCVCVYGYTHTHTYMFSFNNYCQTFQSVCASLCSYHRLCGGSAQSCLTLCHPMDCGPPSSSVHGILQPRILEWVAISFSRASSQPRDQTRIFCISCIGRWILYHWATWEASTTMRSSDVYPYQYLLISTWQF